MKATIESAHSDMDKKREQRLRQSTCLSLLDMLAEAATEHVRAKASKGSIFSFDVSSTATVPIQDLSNCIGVRPASMAAGILCDVGLGHLSREQLGEAQDMRIGFESADSFGTCASFTDSARHLSCGEDGRIYFKILSTKPCLSKEIRYGHSVTNKFKQQDMTVSLYTAIQRTDRVIQLIQNCHGPFKSTSVFTMPVLAHATLRNCLTEWVDNVYSLCWAVLPASVPDHDMCNSIAEKMVAIGATAAAQTNNSFFIVDEDALDSVFILACLRALHSVDYVDRVSCNNEGRSFWRLSTKGMSALELSIKLGRPVMPLQHNPSLPLKGDTPYMLLDRLLHEGWSLCVLSKNKIQAASPYCLGGRNFLYRARSANTFSTHYLRALADADEIFRDNSSISIYHGGVDRSSIQ